LTGTILVGGNDENMRCVLEYRLREAGYSVLVSTDSVDTWVRAMAEQPDLVVLDLSLPYFDTLTVMEQIRKGDRRHRPPMLILSTLRADELQGNGPALNRVEFVLKPFSLRQLVADIARILCEGERPTIAADRE
jgi:DNA-binding response OmpR family regulator